MTGVRRGVGAGVGVGVAVGASVGVASARSGRCRAEGLARRRRRRRGRRRRGHGVGSGVAVAVGVADGSSAAATAHGIDPSIDDPRTAARSQRRIRGRASVGRSSTEPTRRGHRSMRVDGPRRTATMVPPRCATAPAMRSVPSRRSDGDCGVLGVAARCAANRLKYRFRSAVLVAAAPAGLRDSHAPRVDARSTPPLRCSDPVARLQGCDQRPEPMREDRR